MADRFPYLVKTTTSTTGSNPYVLGTADLPSAHRTPKQAVADGSLTDGDTVQYMCRDASVLSDANFERGFGVYDDTLNTITRTAANVFDSSNGPGVLFSWPASGVRDIYFEDIDESKVAKLGKENVFTEDQEIQGQCTVNGADGHFVCESPGATRAGVFRADNVGNFVHIGTMTSTNFNLIRGGNAVASCRDEEFHVGTSSSDVMFAVEGDTVLNSGGTDNDMQVKGLGDDNLLYANAGDDRVGIGISTPDGKLHVHKGSAGIVTADADGDDLIVESSGNTGISILAPDANIGHLIFGDPSDNRGCELNFSGTEFKMFTNVTGGTVKISGGTAPLDQLIVSAATVPRVHINTLLQLTPTSTPADPTTTEYPADDTFGIHINTASGDEFLVWNQAGTIKKILWT